MKNLGTITVKVYRATIGRSKLIKKSAAPSHTAPKENLIHEMVKKAALSHQVGFVSFFPHHRSAIPFANFEISRLIDLHGKKL